MYTWIKMSNIFTQLYIHFVFAVKYRKAVIEESWEDRLQKCITGVVQKNGHKLLAINILQHYAVEYDEQCVLHDLLDG
ncbi:transposase [Mucilaginibacter sp.]|uniref:transposase n=1 Tax=Mucilaginibacter sp. TaxID=1882438 RepID=UPI00283B3237|nr:transposase [Mucilaginibacter sp.]MDR3697086.1 transposase [Mucilaginibacter sp.]